MTNNNFVFLGSRTIGRKIVSWILAVAMTINSGYAPALAFVAYATEEAQPSGGSAKNFVLSEAETNVLGAAANVGNTGADNSVFSHVDNGGDNVPRSDLSAFIYDLGKGHSDIVHDGHKGQNGSETARVIELFKMLGASGGETAAVETDVAHETGEFVSLLRSFGVENDPAIDAKFALKMSDWNDHPNAEHSETGVLARATTLVFGFRAKIAAAILPTAYATGSGSPVTVVATKIVCDRESDLPNWGAYGHVVTANTATDYVAAHPSCRLQSDWKFQWGFIKPDHSYGVMPLPGDFVGEADGSAGSGTNTGTTFVDWKTFGPTNTSGKATVTIDLPNNQTAVKIREVLRQGYIPFTDDTSNSVSAEIKCGDDNWGYSNYNWIGIPTPGKTYYCVAWNVPKTTPPPTPDIVTIVATKIVCNDEADLPNWGNGGPDITSVTAANFLATHPGCRAESGWDFQWGYGDKPEATGVHDPGRDFVGPAPTGLTYGTWKTFGPTDASGKTTAAITNIAGAPKIWVREVLKQDYIPFTFDQTHQSNADNVTAELYCSDDVLNYDNYDYVQSPAYGSSYHCVAWNVSKFPTPQCRDGKDNDGDGKKDYPADPGCSDPEDNDENQPPAITLLGANPMTVIVGTAFSDPGATAADPEDGNITANIVKTGTVNTNFIGSYTISYNVVDSKGLAAMPKARTVNVVPAPKECSDGVDNDGDGMIDYPADTGCTSTDDDDENNPPVITLLGANPIMVTKGDAFTDPGATATDPEDGNITGSIVKTGVVNTNVLGTYTLTYNVSDSDGLAATPKMRIVNVVAACSDGKDNDTPADGKIDYPLDPGCSGPNDNDENTRPVITVVGLNPMNIPEGSVFTDPGATAHDAEDGNITGSIVAVGSVNTLVPGAYAVTYNVSDSKGLAATPKTRTVNVIAVPKKECSDGVDNDGDGMIDYPADTGCTSTDDDDENNPPVITVLGDNPMIVTLGDSFTDPGATALDPEEGTVAVNSTGVVNSGALGTYTITYTATDSKGLAATPKTRTVNVVAACSDGKDNDTPADGKADYPADPGCSDPNDNDENEPPVITLLGANPLEITAGDPFTDPGATALDPEEGGVPVVTTGVVDSGTVGTYTLTYNAEDSKGLAAVPVTRTVKVNPPLTQCNDTIDNDGDGMIDYPADTGCTSTDDDDENNPPVITLLGANPIMVTLGDAFTDPGATANDPEDGPITPSASGVVNTGALGTYTITHTAEDSKGLAATPKTRTVNVVAACSDGKDNDGDGMIDFASDTGCSGPEDNDENNPPVITLLGNDPIILTEGDIWSDPGATALDPEEGGVPVVTTGIVDSGTVGTYTLTYNAEDSKGLAAVPVTRTVIVNPLPPVNQPPVITVLGDDPIMVTQGDAFTDPGATANDPEDGPVTVNATGTVDTTTLGAYTITYTAEDSKGLAATPKTRTVNVVAACSDGKDNDTPTDGKADYPTDPGCSDPEDNDENEPPAITLLGANPMTVTVATIWSDPGATATDPEEGDLTGAIVTTGTVNTSATGTATIVYTVADNKGLTASTTRTVNVVAANQPPVITLLGANPMTITVNTVFTDPGATALDPEDGDRTAYVVTTGVVNASSTGTYTLVYNVVDTQGLAATPVTRTVIVQSGGGGCTSNCGGGTPPICSNGGDDDGDGLADYPRDPGCDSSTDNDETNGGGGGGGPTPLTIYNERITIVDNTTVTITWNTNLNADSRVVYGTTAVASLGAAPGYGYAFSNATDATATVNHTMTIAGLATTETYYFRPVSNDNRTPVVGIELVRGEVLGETFPEACFYLRTYLRLGYNNDPEEVRKLQTFLRDEEGFTDLAVTGFFGIETDKAVRVFQERYRADVLDPWGLPANTGYVYYTTQKKVNELHCKRLFPLNETQIREIAEYYDYLKTIHERGAAMPSDVQIRETISAIIAPETPEVSAGVPQAPVALTPSVETVAEPETNGEPIEISAAQRSPVEHSVQKVALKDLLATMPAANPLEEKGEVAGVAVEKTSAFCGAAAGLAEKLDVTVETLAVLVFFTMLALILLAIYAFLAVQARKEERMTIAEDIAAAVGNEVHPKSDR